MIWHLIFIASMMREDKQESVVSLNYAHQINSNSYGGIKRRVRDPERICLL